MPAKTSASTKSGTKKAPARSPAAAKKPVNGAAGRLAGAMAKNGAAKAKNGAAKAALAKPAKNGAAKAALAKPAKNAAAKKKTATKIAESTRSRVSSPGRAAPSVNKASASKSASAGMAKPAARKAAPAKAARKAAPAQAASKAAPAQAASKAMATPTPKPAPKVGSKAPAFALPADDGSVVRLSDLKGQKVVLYFYPKDNTPGCTVEACGFRDLHPDFEGLNAVVLGVSRDSVKSHAGFKTKQSLPFRLLSDPSAETIAAYGSWGEKTFMGRTSVGILRTTMIIDEQGKVAKVYPKVAIKTHAAEVKADLEAL